MRNAIIFGIILILGISLVGACPFRDKMTEHKECKYDNGEDCPFTKSGTCHKSIKEDLYSWKLLPLKQAWLEKKDFRFHRWDRKEGCQFNKEGVDWAEKKAAILEKYDLDGDGQITWEEKKTFWGSKH